MPIGCRSDTTTSTVDGSERRSAASRTQGDASSRWRQRVQVGPHQALAAQPAQHGQHLALRQPLVAADDDAIDLQHVRLRRRPRRRGRRRTPATSADAAP